MSGAFAQFFFASDTNLSLPEVVTHSTSLQVIILGLNGTNNSFRGKDAYGNWSLVRLDSHSCWVLPASEKVTDLCYVDALVVWFEVQILGFVSRVLPLTHEEGLHPQFPGAFKVADFISYKDAVSALQV
jgi:hypothetical protein